MSDLVLGIRSDAKEGDIQTPEEMVERVHAVLHKTGYYICGHIRSRDIVEEPKFEVRSYKVDIEC